MVSSHPLTGVMMRQRMKSQGVPKWRDYESDPDVRSRPKADIRLFEADGRERPRMVIFGEIRLTSLISRARYKRLVMRLLITCPLGI